MQSLVPGQAICHARVAIITLLLAIAPIIKLITFLYVVMIC